MLHFLVDCEISAGKSFSGVTFKMVLSTWIEIDGNFRWNVSNDKPFWSILIYYIRRVKKSELRVQVSWKLKMQSWRWKLPNIFW